MRRSRGMLVVGAGLALLLTRCVGDDPGSINPTPEAGVIVIHDDAATGSLDGSASSSSSGGPADAAVDCGPTTTSVNCGRCGRACAAGASCTDGQCAPQVLFDTGVTLPYGLAVGAEKVFLAQEKGVLAGSEAVLKSTDSSGAPNAAFV